MVGAELREYFNIVYREHIKKIFYGLKGAVASFFKIPYMYKQTERLHDKKQWTEPWL